MKKCRRPKVVIKTLGDDDNRKSITQGLLKISNK